MADFSLSIQDMARLVLREMCNKLPLTRSGRSFYVSHAEQKEVVRSMAHNFNYYFYLIYDHRVSKGLYRQQFRELTEIALEKHFSMALTAGINGRRIDKGSGLEDFLDGIVKEMDSYGLFGGSVNVERMARVAEILSSWRTEQRGKAA